VTAIQSIATVLLILAAPIAVVWHFIPRKEHPMEDEYEGRHRTQEELLFERWPSGYEGRHERPEAD
jgi:hypothetical protein